MYYWLLVCTLFSFTTSGQDKWSLSKCVDYGLANNYTIKQNNFRAQTAQVDYKQSKNAFLPTANISITPGVSFGRSPVQNAFVYTNQSILNSGITSGTSITLLNSKINKNNIAKNELEWKGFLTQSESLKNDLTLSIITFYLQALLSKELIKPAELQFMQSKIEYSNTIKMVRAGILPELNAAQLEAQIAKDSLNLILTIESFQQNLLGLKNYMSLDPAVPFDIETPAVDKIPVASFAELEPETVFKLAVTNQPLLKIDSLKIKISETELLISRLELRPKLSLNIGFSSGFSQVLSKSNNYSSNVLKQIQNNFSQYVGLSFSLPLFDGFVTKSKVIKNKISIKSQLLTIDQDELVLKQDIYKAHLDAVTAFQKLNASAISVQTAERSHAFAEKRYLVNLLSTLDLILSQNNVYKLRQEYIMNQFEYIFKMKILEFYKGSGLRL